MRNSLLDLRLVKAVSDLTAALTNVGERRPSEAIADEWMDGWMVLVGSLRSNASQAGKWYC